MCSCGGAWRRQTVRACMCVARCAACAARLEPRAVGGEEEALQDHQDDHTLGRLDADVLRACARGDASAATNAGTTKGASRKPPARACHSVAAFMPLQARGAGAGARARVSALPAERKAARAGSALADSPALGKAALRLLAHERVDEHAVREDEPAGRRQAAPRVRLPCGRRPRPPRTHHAKMAHTT